MAARSLSTTALWDEERGALEKKLDLARGKMMRKRGVKGGGWITQEEDCLFSTGQTGLSSTFTYGDESALRYCQFILAAPSKQGKNTRGNREM